jgi:hypothetical protein
MMTESCKIQILLLLRLTISTLHLIIPTTADRQSSPTTSKWLVLPQHRNGCTVAASFAGGDQKEHEVAIQDGLPLCTDVSISPNVVSRLHFQVFSSSSFPVSQ